MPQKQSNEIVEVIHMNGYAIYRFSDGKEYKVHRLVRDMSVSENIEAATYSERIAPQAIRLDEALKARGLNRTEWFRQREEEAMSALWHCKVKTTVVENKHPST